MGQIERRKNPRVQVCDPISYLSLDPDKKTFQNNVAVVRNVSQMGIRIETFQEIGAKHITLMFFDLNTNQMEVRGEVIYCERNDCGQYNVGINLTGTSYENRLFVKALVKFYHYQKKKSHMAISPGIQN